MSEIPSDSDSDRDPIDQVTTGRRRVPKLGYPIIGVPKRYQDQVQLTAVLRPYSGRGRLRTDADIINATACILRSWRNRAKQLAMRGYKPLAGDEKKARLDGAMGCRPTFVMTRGPKGRRACCLPTICPFCWAREVWRHWLVIDRAFFPPVPKVKQRVRVVDTGPETKKSSSFTRSVKDVEIPVNSAYDLVRRFFTYEIPASVKVTARTGQSIGSVVAYDVSGIFHWLQSRTQGKPDPKLHRLPECRALLKAADPGGGLLETIRFRRVPDGGPDGFHWRIQVWQLILAADGDKVPAALPENTVGPRHHKVFAKPKRKFVVGQVARALLYPTWLIDMRVPVEEVIDYLLRRRNFRLIVTYGRFRPSKV